MDSTHLIQAEGILRAIQDELEKSIRPVTIHEDRSGLSKYGRAAYELLGPDKSILARLEVSGLNNHKPCDLIIDERDPNVAEITRGLFHERKFCFGGVWMFGKNTTGRNISGTMALQEPRSYETPAQQSAPQPDYNKP